MPMQILLHTDPNTDGSQAMQEHLAKVVQHALERFGDRVTRVEAHLSDANGAARSSADDIHCMFEAHLVGADAIIVRDQAGNAHQAIDGALRKLKRTIGAAVAKHDPRRLRAAMGVAPAEPSEGDAGQGISSSTVNVR